MVTAILVDFTNRLQVLEKTQSKDEAKALYDWFKSNADIVRDSVLNLLKTKMQPESFKMPGIEPKRDKFIQCASKGSYEFLPVDHPGERAIQKQNVDIYLSTIKDPDVKIYLDAAIRHTRYIPDQEFQRAFMVSFLTFQRQIGDQKYAMLLMPEKYGSEWWLTQNLFATILKGEEPEIIIESTPETDPKHILIVDDAIYFGVNISEMLDVFFYDRDVDKFPDDRYVFHIVVPYISTQGYQEINRFLLKISKGKANAIFYPAEGKTLPSFNELEPNLIQRLKDEKKAYMVTKEIGTSDPFLIYFDHKIAEAVLFLKNVVIPPPTKDPIRRAMECYKAT